MGFVLVSCNSDPRMAVIEFMVRKKVLLFIHFSKSKLESIQLIPLALSQGERRLKCEDNFLSPN
jgi:hypothetical protein